MSSTLKRKRPLILTQLPFILRQQLTQALLRRLAHANGTKYVLVHRHQRL